MRRVIVIGAGPAGMAAAIAAARGGAKVTLLEGEGAPGRKLLLTGNGRCNLSNREVCAESYARAVETEMTDPLKDPAAAFAGPAVTSCGPEELCRFFEQIGMPLANRDGWLYPASRSARTVLQVLEAELSGLKVTMKCGEKIRNIRRAPDGWEASTSSWTYRGDALILCAGSRALPQTGSDGSGYVLASQAGHTVTGILPALTALIPGDASVMKECAGVRCGVLATLLSENGTRLYGSCGRIPPEAGELQIAADGLSGIAVFQLSRPAARLLAQGKVPVLALDFFPGYDDVSLHQLLTACAERGAGRPAQEAFAGIAVPKLTAWLLRQAGIPLREPPGDPGTVCRKLLPVLKDLHIRISGTRSFDSCQVCAGGIPLDEILPGTMESRIAPGLYFAGELIDIDGPCGGFNLHWAFASGLLAGRSASGAQ